jgi:hypothetical protein
VGVGVGEGVESVGVGVGVGVAVLSLLQPTSGRQAAAASAAQRMYVFVDLWVIMEWIKG